MICYYLNVHFQGQRVNGNWIFSTDFEKKKKNSNIKYLEVGPEEGDLFLADVQTDRHDEAKNGSRNFTNAPNKAFEYRLKSFSALRIFKVNALYYEIKRRCVSVRPVGNLV